MLQQRITQTANGLRQVEVCHWQRGVLFIERLLRHLDEAVHAVAIVANAVACVGVGTHRAAIVELPIPAVVQQLKQQTSPRSKRRCAVVREAVDGRVCIGRCVCSARWHSQNFV